MIDVIKVVKKGGLLWFASAVGALGLTLVSQGVYLLEGITCLGISAVLFISREVLKKENEE